MDSRTQYGLMLRARIDNGLHSRLVEEARRQDRSLSSLCRLILRKGLDEVEVSQPVGSQPTGTLKSLVDCQANTNHEA